MTPPRRRRYSVLLVRGNNRFARIERRGRSTREVKEKVEEEAPPGWRVVLVTSKDAQRARTRRRR